MSIYFRSRLFHSFFLITAHFCFTVRLLVSLLSLSQVIFIMLNSNSWSMWPITFLLFYIGIVLFICLIIFSCEVTFPWDYWCQQSCLPRRIDQIPCLNLCHWQRICRAS